uniref:Uncharacterized protein n=1 Tax=Oryza glumipatula TaxID=40148 RepID=A0A0E0ALY3_9ORYZ
MAGIQSLFAAAPHLRIHAARSPSLGFWYITSPICSPLHNSIASLASLLRQHAVPPPPPQAPPRPTQIPYAS